MKCVFQFILAGVLVMLVAACQHKPTPIEPRGDNVKIEGVSKADSPSEFAKAVNALVSDASEEELLQLVANPDCRVALAAGWERVRQTVPIEEKQGEPSAPDRQALSRFLGLVERLIGVPIPGLWETCLMSADSHGRNNIWFSLPEDVWEKMGPTSPDILHRKGDKWVVKQGNETWAIEDCVGGVEKVDIVVADDMAFVVLYDWPPYPYMLYALDREGGKVIWSTRVWAAGDLMNYEGLGWHEVDLRATSNKIVVFGISCGAAYVEVFDKKTGTNLCRFGTSYFEYQP